MSKRFRDLVIKGPQPEVTLDGKKRKSYLSINYCNIRGANRELEIYYKEPYYKSDNEITYLDGSFLWTNQIFVICFKNTRLWLYYSLGDLPMKYWRKRIWNSFKNWCVKKNPFCKDTSA